MIPAKKSARYSLWFFVPALVLYLVFFIIPNIMSFIFGFTDWNINFLDEMKFNGLDNFKQMLDTPYLITALFNTFFFTIFTGIFKNLFGLILALVVNIKLKLTNYLRTVFFAPLIISPLVIGLVFSAIYNPQNGLLNVFLRNIGLGFMAREWLVDVKHAMLSICYMDIWQSTGFCMVIYLAGLQSVPEEYYDASLIDGANYFQQIKNVTIPLIMPSFIVSILLSIIGGLKVFGQVYSLTNGGPLNQTQVISTLIYKSFGDGLLGYSSAMGLIFTLIVCIVSFVLLGLFRKLEVEM
jgi:raffinose/stachyose/melibiose transport system permease protein